MKRRQAALRLLSLLICLALVMTSCGIVATPEEKASSLLLSQIELRQQQIAEPTVERLEHMKAMGMNVDNLHIQRICIYLSEPLTQPQIEELEALGLSLYLDSWILPTGSHPQGFIIADMPIDRLKELAEKGYVVRLDTAERVLEPQNGSQPQLE